MATTILGKVGLTPKGAWAEGTTYERLDVVSNGGSSYMSLQDNNTAALTDTSKWLQIAAKGDAFTYEDFTEAQISVLQKPATDAAAKANNVNATIADDTFIVTDRNGTQHTLSLANEATVGQLLSEVDGRISKMWINVMAEQTSALEVNGVKVVLPAHRSVLIKDPYSLLTYQDVKDTDKDPRRIARFDVHYNGFFKPTKWSFGKWNNQLLGMSSVEYIDVSGLDTSGLTSMYIMFIACSALKTLDVSGWDTSNVTSMGYMFQFCYKINNLDMSGWDLTNVTNIGNMFGNCYSLANIIFGPGWGKQTSTEASALTLDLSWCNSNNNYQLSDETWSSMLTMYDRATAGLTAMTIKIKSTANIPEEWEDSMAALGYTITKV